MQETRTTCSGVIEFVFPPADLSILESKPREAMRSNSNVIHSVAESDTSSGEMGGINFGRDGDLRSFSNADCINTALAGNMLLSNPFSRTPSDATSKPTSIGFSE